MLLTTVMKWSTYETTFVYHKHQKCNLVLDTMSDWQPVQLRQRRTDMVARWQTKCDPSSGVLHSLQRADSWLRTGGRTELHYSSRVDWRWKRTPAASWYRCPRDVGVAEAGVDDKSRCWPSCWRVASWPARYRAGRQGCGQISRFHDGRTDFQGTVFRL